MALCSQYSPHPANQDSNDSVKRAENLERMTDCFGFQLRRLARLPVRTLLGTCVSWEPHREILDGYSIALACAAALASRWLWPIFASAPGIMAVVCMN